MSKYFKYPKADTNFAPPKLVYPVAQGGPDQHDLPMAGKDGMYAAYHENPDFYYEVGDGFDISSVVSFETQGGAQADLSQLAEITVDQIPDNVQVTLPSAQKKS